MKTMPRTSHTTDITSRTSMINDKLTYPNPRVTRYSGKKVSGSVDTVVSFCDIDTDLSIILSSKVSILFF